MTISVTYNSVYGDISVKEVLSAWSAGFKTAGHGESNTGGFNTGARSYDGEQYATHGANGSD